MSQGQYKSAMKHPQNSTGASSGKATFSLVLGIVSFVGMCFTGIPGVILGIMALGDISKSGGRMKGKGLAIAGIVLGSIGILWTMMVGVLAGLLIPAVQQVRVAAKRATSMNNMRQITLAMHNYESAFATFPKPDYNGLSWRVEILPFLGEQELYDSFNHDEPWNSSHNIQLLDQMPSFFACPGVDELPSGFTVYQVPVTDVVSNPELMNGSVSAFDNSGKGVGFGQIMDGSSNTIALLEVNPSAAVEWTRPADWDFDPNNPKRNLGDVWIGRQVLISAMDGSVHSIDVELQSPEEFKGMLTRNGGETVTIY